MHHRPFRNPARWLATAAAVCAVTLASACGGTGSDPASAQDRAYCQALEESKDDFGVLQEGELAAFATAITTFHGLAEKAPAPVAEDWKVFDGAFRALEKDLSALGLEVADLEAITAGDIPKGLDVSEITEASELLTGLVSDEVATAANDIERHALEACELELAA